MKRAAWQDLECICDENVTDNLSLRDKKIYASIILRSASGKRNSPAFGTQFSMEGPPRPSASEIFFGGRADWDGGFLQFWRQ